MMRKKGIPEDGIPPVTLWNNIPENWCCPERDVEKSDFQLVEI
jgi:rubredoxin